jgi:hypothetical protein
MDNKEKDFHNRLSNFGYSNEEIEIIIQLMELSDEYVTNPKSNDFKNTTQRIINNYCESREKGDF